MYILTVLKMEELSSELFTVVKDSLGLFSGSMIVARTRFWLKGILGDEFANCHHDDDMDDEKYDNVVSI